MHTNKHIMFIIIIIIYIISKVSDSFSKVNTYTTNYLLVFGVRKSMTILEFKALCIDIDLKLLSLCSAAKEKEHIRIKLTRHVTHGKF